MTLQLRVKLLDNESIAWEDYVNSHPAATNYHQLAWKKVIEQSFGHRTFYLMAWEGGKVRGVLPLVLIKSRLFRSYIGSLPFFNYGGLLSDDISVEKALLECAIKLARDNFASYLELRHIEKKNILVKTKQRKVTMMMNLESDPEAIWKTFNPKLRNQIRKALKEGLKFHVGGHENLLNFYNVFSINMRDLGTPVYSLSFFREILDNLPTAKIISVSNGEKVIAAGLACSYRKSMEVPWASSLKKYNALCPNNLLYWGIIQLAIEEGCERFDFGRSTPDSGTYKFKAQWGAIPIQMHWQYWVENESDPPEVNPQNPNFHLAIQIWRKLPLGITRWLGPHIVRNIP